MKKSWKGILTIGLFFLLSGCRSQMNQTFLNRLTELQSHNHLEASLSFSDQELPASTADSGFVDALSSLLDNVRYEVVMQKDSDQPENIAWTGDMIALGSHFPFLKGTSVNGHFLMGMDSYLSNIAPFQIGGNSAISGDSWEHLKEDYKDTFLLLSDEWDSNEEALQLSTSKEKIKQQKKQLLALRKAFLKIDPENFSETETDLTLILEKKELKELLVPFSENSVTDSSSSLFGYLNDHTSDWLDEDSQIEVEVTLSKEKERLTANFYVEGLDSVQADNLELKMQMNFSDREGKVEVPPIQKVVTQARIQNLLTPLHEGPSTSGYAEDIFKEVKEKIKAKRDNYEYSETTAQQLLEAYYPLLTEEQYRQLEEILDLDTIAHQFDNLPSWDEILQGDYSDIPSTGYPEERFQALIESVQTYRKNQTKESAQKTLDKYRDILNEEQYKKLEEVLDIGQLPSN